MTPPTYYGASWRDAFYWQSVCRRVNVSESSKYQLTGRRRSTSRLLFLCIVVNTSSSSRLFCLDFDHDFLLNGLAVTLNNVIINHYWSNSQGKQAYFNGNSASIEVPALSNVQFNAFGISLWFRRSGTDTNPQGLVHNGDCKQSGSIRILSVDQNDVSAGVLTTNYNVNIESQTVSSLSLRNQSVPLLCVFTYVIKFSVAVDGLNSGTANYNIPLKSYLLSFTEIFILICIQQRRE